MSLEGLDPAFRKVVPDSVVASGTHVEEADEARRDGWRVPHPKLPADPKQNPLSSDEKSGVCTQGISVIFNLFIVLSDYWRCRRRATTFAPEARLTHPTSVATSK